MDEESTAEQAESGEEPVFSTEIEVIQDNELQHYTGVKWVSRVENNGVEGVLIRFSDENQGDSFKARAKIVSVGDVEVPDDCILIAP